MFRFKLSVVMTITAEADDFKFQDIGTSKKAKIQRPEVRRRRTGEHKQLDAPLTTA